MVNRTGGGDGIETYNLYVGDAYTHSARFLAEAKSLSVDRISLLFLKS